MEEERDKADRVKQEFPILVVLGNPPYNGFAGLPAEEEARAGRAVPIDEDRSETAGPGAERPLRPLLPRRRTLYHRAAREARASSVTSQITRGWTAYRILACASAFSMSFDQGLDRLAEMATSTRQAS